NWRIEPFNLTLGFSANGHDETDTYNYLSYDADLDKWTISSEEQEEAIDNETGYCDDGIDNDGDGCIDAQDSDCGGIEEECEDGSDNDCDGLIDSLDTDCSGGFEYE
ncbi:MAG: hypothetical protein U9R21_07260, partial [Candidatus Thermoplasmatota archaeon]|nr:hypothetical protein [Candidatus Thermoplasmatota archaeon]